MRIVFAGSPPAAVPSLRVLTEQHDVAAVVTRPPTPQGRRRALTPTPVAVEAAAHGLRVMETARLGAHESDAIAKLEPDLGVVVAYGGLIREPLLSLPTHGWINLHFSLLPAYRGAAPVQRALIEGRPTTGVSVFRLVHELDAGPIVRMREVNIEEGDTAGVLLERLAELGAADVSASVAAIADRSATFVEQKGEVSLAPKLVLADGAIDFGRPASEVLSRWRGVTPEPGAHASLEEGERLKLLQLARSGVTGVTPGSAVLEGRTALVGTATGALELVEVQPAGKRGMSGADWLRGRGGSAKLSVPVPEARD